MRDASIVRWRNTNVRREEPSKARLTGKTQIKADIRYRLVSRDELVDRVFGTQSIQIQIWRYSHLHFEQLEKMWSGQTDLAGEAVHWRFFKEFLLHKP